MKKIIYFITLLICLGCSDDFLNLAPQHYSSEASFYQTEAHFEQALNGTYQKLRGVVGISGYLIGEMRSDNTHYTIYMVDRGEPYLFREEIADFTNDNRNQWSSEMYSECYSGISRTNAILSRIGNMDFAENFKNRIIGETKFLRAFYYFQLVRCFGGVTLHLEEVKGTGNAFLPRASLDEVYKQIMEDVDDAIAKLGVVAFPQDGAATKGAARMLKAYVLMTRPNRDYPGAEAELREIMKMGYELLPDYNSIYETSNKNHRESIFDVQFQQGDQGQHSGWLYHFIPKTINAEKITGVPDCNTVSSGGWNVPTQDIIDLYESGDKRLDVSVAVAVGSLDKVSGLFYPEDVLNINDEKISDYEMSYYFINKYRHPHAKVGNTDDNWPLYRYADALLLLSECLVEQDKAGDALPYVNQIRTRAGLSPLEKLDAELLAKERRLELAFENHRWYDLVRTGKAVEVMNAYGKKLKQQYTYLLERTYQVTQDKLLFAIPYREMQINELLEQNPGY